MAKLGIVTLLLFTWLASWYSFQILTDAAVRLGSVPSHHGKIDVQRDKRAVGRVTWRGKVTIKMGRCMSCVAN